MGSDLSAVEQLGRIIIHYDWNGYNLIWGNERILGLLDFDSLVEAPRIVDFVNALVYASTTNHGVDTRRLEIFIRGYVSISRLSPAEVELIYPCAVDGLVRVILGVLGEQKRKNDCRIKDELLMHLTQALLWMLHNSHEFDATVARLNAERGGNP